MVGSPKSRSRCTLDLYSKRLKDFCSFLESHRVFGQVTVDQAIVGLNLTIIDDFYKHLINKGLAASTVRGYESLIKSFTNWLASESSGKVHKKSLYCNSGFRTSNPSKGIPRYLLPNEVIQLSKGMRWEIQRLITHFIFDTGVRVSEVLRVTQDDIPNMENYPETDDYFPLRIKGSKGRNGAYKMRDTIISRPLLVRLNRYFNSKSYMFANYVPNPKQARPAFFNVYGEELTIKAIQKFMDDAAHRAGLGKKVSPHRLRHGTAISILKAKESGSFLDNLLYLQKMLGHASIKTTEIYTQIPVALLQKLREASNNPLMIKRIEESEKIFKETYIRARELPPIKKIGVKVE
nr:tyrosine-type recombinase/integrase [Methylophilus sp. QUAN]